MKWFLTFLCIVLIVSCSQSPKSQKDYQEWKGAEEFKEFLQQSSIAQELIYPGSQGDYGAIVRKETHMYLYTDDNHNVIAKHYRSKLTEDEWKLDIDESDEGISLLGLEKGIVELIIVAKLQEDGKTKIEISHRPY